MHEEEQKHSRKCKQGRKRRIKVNNLNTKKLGMMIWMDKLKEKVRKR